MTDSSPDALGVYRASTEFEAGLKVLRAPRPAFGGLWGASLAFTLAALRGGRDQESRTIDLIVTASPEEADELADELELFSSLPVATFPAWESLFLMDSVPDGRTYRRRLEVVAGVTQRGKTDKAGFIVASAQSLLQPVVSRATLERSRLLLEANQDYEPYGLAERLIACGYRDVALVERRGELSLRGDVLDLFPYQGENPLRMEFFGDTLESIREFRAETQRSVKDSERRAVDLFLMEESAFFRDGLRRKEDILLLDLLGEGDRIVVKNRAEVEERAGKVLGNLLRDGAEEITALFLSRLGRLSQLDVSALPVDSKDGCNLSFGSVETLRGADLAEVCGSLRDRLSMGFRLELYAENPAEARRFEEILGDHDLRVGTGAATGAIAEGCSLALRIGSLRRGFEVSSLKMAFLTTRELFNRHTVRRVRKKTPNSRPIQSFLDLAKGDYIVHLAHGVGRYLGMECLEKEGAEQEFLVLEFRGGVKLYVPVSKIDLVQKFVGAGDKPPSLDKVGGTSWARKKEQVEDALFDLACDLIEVQAMRQERPGIAYPSDSEWQREFEAAFPYEETPDQTEVTTALKIDMRSSRPMDRLICGDVGYGKTELAMRAAFKAVDAGRQVAVLVPTTVLAQQHFRTFRDRMAGFPITIDVISRFRTKGQQKKVLEAAAAGQVDILIGTHRILSKDVGFRDLGLIIIDEEQRFGVAHKEKLKQLRSIVDVLTLSATPIPRTLHMSLLGIRDISSLATPPAGRNSVSTEICHYEPERVREAILRELNRDGQIYFVHNRVHDIQRVKFELEKLVPEARIEYGHGQMNEHELEKRMARFVEGEADLLISTTIIESGIDIPNVNTIFIDEADHYGLSDLHQLRGRVGRYKHQAYCYLLVPDDRPVNPDALKRLRALIEFSNLGAGFQIAMRDLEIRGAGNILGAAQSGHIALVGYDTYCRLLEKAVRKQKHEVYTEPVHVEVDFAVEAFVPEDYVSGEARKVELYRKVSQALSGDEIDELAEELRDRYGPLPEQLERLLRVQKLRVFCADHGVEYLGRDGEHLLLRGGDAMKSLLTDCTARVVILDAKTAAVSLAPKRGRRVPQLDDEYALAVAYEWFRTGEFPTAADLRKGTLAKKAMSKGAPTKSGVGASRASRPPGSVGSVGSVATLRSAKAVQE